MKKLMVLLVGFGMILLAGAVENSLAQDSQSVFSRYALSDDSLRALSLQAQARTYFVHVDPGPANPAKVAGEFLAGGFGAVVFGAVGAQVGYGMTYHEENGLVNLSGLPGALAGYPILSNLGCAAGVTLVGNTGGERGSYSAAFGGSCLGTLVGGLLAFAIVGVSDDDSAWDAFLALPAAQSGGATLFFNRTRKRKMEVPSVALLNLNDGKLCLAPPQVSISQDSPGSGGYRVNLFQANF
jgi:hypothetical protein